MTLKAILACAKQLYKDFLKISTLLNGGIDTIQEPILNFAHTRQYLGKA